MWPAMILLLTLYSLLTRRAYLSQPIHIRNICNATLIGDSNFKVSTLEVAGNGTGISFCNISSILYIAYLNIGRGENSVMNIKDAKCVFITNCQIAGGLRNYSNIHGHHSTIVISSVGKLLISETSFENNQLVGSSPSANTGGPALSVSHSIGVSIINRLHFVTIL